MEHGDHVALFHGFDAPLVECTSVPDLKEAQEYDCYITPHHMGYKWTGFRGYNWAAFSQDRQTPFVEMFSRHGLAESDTGDYDYLHDMGPRIWEGSIQYGLEQGHKFGLMCSTDQHAGYRAATATVVSASTPRLWTATPSGRTWANAMSAASRATRSKSTSASTAAFRAMSSGPDGAKSTSMSGGRTPSTTWTSSRTGSALRG